MDCNGKIRSALEGHGMGSHQNGNSIYIDTSGCIGGSNHIGYTYGNGQIMATGGSGGPPTGASGSNVFYATGTWSKPGDSDGDLHLSPSEILLLGSLPYRAAVPRLASLICRGKAATTSELVSILEQKCSDTDAVSDLHKACEHQCKVMALRQERSRQTEDTLSSPSITINRSHLRYSVLTAALPPNLRRILSLAGKGIASVRLASGCVVVLVETNEQGELGEFICTERFGLILRAGKTDAILVAPTCESVGELEKAVMTRLEEEIGKGQ